MSGEEGQNVLLVAAELNPVVESTLNLLAPSITKVVCGAKQARLGVNKLIKAQVVDVGIMIAKAKEANKPGSPNAGQRLRKSVRGAARPARLLQDGDFGRVLLYHV